MSPDYRLEEAHRWLWFGATGDRDEFGFTVHADQKRSVYDRHISDLLATIAGHEPIYGNPMPIVVGCACGWRVKELYEDYDAHLRAALTRPDTEGEPHA